MWVCEIDFKNYEKILNSIVALFLHYHRGTNSTRTPSSITKSYDPKRSRNKALPSPIPEGTKNIKYEWDFGDGT
jgi:hypothetical protein